MFRVFVCIVLMLFSSIALSAGLTDEAPEWLAFIMKMLSFMPGQIGSTIEGFIMAFAGVMFGVMAICRALSEVFADKTKTTVDNKIGQTLGQIADWCARICGWFGLGYPNRR